MYIKRQKIINVVFLQGIIICHEIHEICCNGCVQELADYIKIVLTHKIPKYVERVWGNNFADYDIQIIMWLDKNNYLDSNTELYDDTHIKMLGSPKYIEGIRYFKNNFKYSVNKYRSTNTIGSSYDRWYYDRLFNKVNNPDFIKEVIDIVEDDFSIINKLDGLSKRITT